MGIIITPDDALQLDLGRVIGGMAWPSDKPGFAVVVGEERIPRKGGSERHCHVLADAFSISKPSLLQSIGELQALYRTQAFYGRSESANLIHLFMFNSSAVQKGLSAINFIQAPYSDSGKLELYADMIIRRLSPTSKSLHLGASDTAKHLNVSPDDRSTATCHTHPAVAALGYAIAVLELYTPFEGDDYDTYTEDTIDLTTGY